MKKNKIDSSSLQSFSTIEKILIEILIREKKPAFKGEKKLSVNLEEKF